MKPLLHHYRSRMLGVLSAPRVLFVGIAVFLVVLALSIFAASVWKQFYLVPVGRETVYPRKGDLGGLGVLLLAAWGAAVAAVRA